MKRSDLNHLRRLAAWRHQSRQLGGALNPSPTGSLGMSTGNQNPWTSGRGAVNRP